MGIEHHYFESEFDKIKARHNVKLDTELDVNGLIELVESYKRIYKKHTHESFPKNPSEQLEKAIEAVFKSWHTSRAIRYRQINDISGLDGTAVNVQTMVFGNMGNDSGYRCGLHTRPIHRQEHFLR